MLCRRSAVGRSSLAFPRLCDKHTPMNRITTPQDIDRLEALVARREPELLALLPEDGRFERLRREWDALNRRYPDPATRPPLFGAVVGVKDIFNVDGFPTRAGSALPPALFAGPEAACVTALRAAGALVLGKTVTTQFAYFAPGPTRHPLSEHPGRDCARRAAAAAARRRPWPPGSARRRWARRPSALSFARRRSAASSASSPPSAASHPTACCPSPPRPTRSAGLGRQ